MVPVGFGLVTPLTWSGRLFLIIYAVVGIPLALVTISDIGKFFCDAAFKFFREVSSMLLLLSVARSIPCFMAALVIMLLLYPIVGGVCIHNVSQLSLFDSVYYCCITILTVGFVDVVAANIIHHVHYMGRQMGKATAIAEKMVLVRLHA
ncbi:unnamed protein product [Angiostrongylus costaricensis]|uniref:Ion_trans_2 domain-containing protein n=1 Tax=Angiostrongylus costaricensis TaxID=334426 RepID=A0A0R3PXS0_ANGCS|nr:unnamed protein product [Angiostrongylus costaricensis]